MQGKNKKEKSFNFSELNNFTRFFSRKDNVKSLDSTWIDKLWSIVAFPERAMEVEVWASKNKSKVLLLNGKHGECLLHWGVLSSISLAMTLNECGLDINAKDKDGKTPFDWLMERYNVSIITKEQKLDDNGESRLKAETQSMICYIWNIGARPSASIKDLKAGSDIKFISNMVNGELYLIKLLYSTYGESVLRGWMNDKRSLIHLWSLCPKSPIKKQGFEALMSSKKMTENLSVSKEDVPLLSIDELDVNERTALWYSLDGIFSDNVDQQTVDMLIDNIQLLLSLGADPDKKDIYKVSPNTILQCNKDHKLYDMINIIFENNKKNKVK